MNQCTFICHYNKDVVIDNKIVVALEKLVIACWIATCYIISRSAYVASIAKGIKNSTHFIFVFTKSSNNSDPVINEIEKANSLKIQIIPFKADWEEYSDSVEYY